MFFYSTRPKLPVRILSVKITHFNEKIFQPRKENSPRIWKFFYL
ncbi:hypothetical protein LSS_20715 [Leptospira santarosai serovar Shermani str. LT 821]|uniref:Uncharacterized protein n=1 Tax=Leptospira santarosai serovar Shermani str. LT 821 TaxID=758847 RepID=A0A097ES91_9LEPT|nr:hypothetical protein LSS_20715 [Leptospira santarosai serovar Shermani str. LT 821]